MTDYEPSKRLAAARAAYQETHEAAEKARAELRAAVAAELLDFDATTAAVATVVPWSEETVRGIAREAGVPHRRKPTVRSIKPQRRAPGK